MDRIASAFSQRPTLKRQIDECLKEVPKYSNLFLEIATYVEELHNTSTRGAGPANKKRKLEGSEAVHLTTGGWTDASRRPEHTVWDVSFSFPARKKYTLHILSGPVGGLRAVNPEGEVEFGLAWDDISQIFCLPVPEKQKRAWNYVVIPYNNHGFQASSENAQDPILWTFQELTAKEKAAAGDNLPEEPAHTAGLLDQYLAPLGKAVVTPSENEFASSIPQSHRRGEKAYHVKAFRGSKEGFLYFLSTGIVFGFKKPLIFFDFADILSISYVSVQRITFNLVVMTQNEEEIEFGMLDQADFAGIDAYVKSNGLNDASLAQDRAAKVYNVNKTKSTAIQNGGTNGMAVDGTGADEEGDGMTELQRAEQQLQDEEDEMEEDFDPDAGESDTGSSDGEEGDEHEEDGDVEEGYEEVDEEEENDASVEDENHQDDVEASAPSASGAFTVVNRHGLAYGMQAPEEPEDGFL